MISINFLKYFYLVQHCYPTIQNQMTRLYLLHEIFTLISSILAILNLF